MTAAQPRPATRSIGVFDAVFDDRFGLGRLGAADPKRPFVSGICSAQDLPDESGMTDVSCVMHGLDSLHTPT
jgi:hypothetical protein